VARTAVKANRNITRRAEVALDALNRRAEAYPEAYDNDPFAQVRRLRAG
jgi:hypothetical protein